MDDRFRNEGGDSSKKNPTPAQPQITKIKPLGDFSENLQSIAGGKQPQVTGGMSQPKPKKFQVFLPEEASSIPDVVPSAPVKSEPIVKEVSGKEYLESIQKKNSEAPFVPATAPEHRVNPPASSPVRAAQKPTVSSVNKRASAPFVRRPATQKAASAPVKAASGSTRKKASEKKKINFINSVLVTCVCVIFISILTITASTVAMTTINDILVIDRDGSNDYISVYIPPEVTEYEGVFEIIDNAGLIKQPLITDIFCKFRHYDEIKRKNEAGEYETVRIKYNPGTYFLNSEMGIECMLEEIMVSSSGYKDTVRLTFPEGWTVAQVFEKLEKYNVCEAEILYANLDIIGEQYDFIKDIGTINGRYLKSEGYLFPDTYDFFIGENAGSVIKKLFNNFEKRWKPEYNDRLKELGMTVDEIINIASIIQREAKDTTQMDVISSVIHNRLNDSATYPTIDMNSTKDYVLSLKEFDLFSDFYYNLYLNSYNSYSAEGLPPGPICNPGAAAIRAALYPEDTDYYFFCHDTNGQIYLAKTVSEHQTNTEKVLYGR